MPLTDDIVRFSKFETACSLEIVNFEAFATRITYELIFKKGFVFACCCRINGALIPTAKARE